jgi:3-phosphoshikimate 1-carboxyvinyltransferase
MFGAIAHGETRVTGLLKADDVQSTLQVFKDLGVNIQEVQGTLIIHGIGDGQFTQPEKALDMGNSGTSTRLIMGLLAGYDLKVDMIGDASLSKRPMDRVADPLREMGASIQANGDKQTLPLTLQGSSDLKPIHYQLPVASAQVKSALILAALRAHGRSTIIEKAPTRNHTEEMIELFGGRIETDGLTITVEGGQTLTGTSIDVPGDISSAAFFIVAALMVPNSKLTLKNVGLNPSRIGILDVVAAMGGKITITNRTQVAGDLTIETSDLTATTIAGDIIPRLIDELPIIALLATQAQGTTIIKDAEELKVKETNRIDATAQELLKMGANVIPTEDGLIIHGPTPLQAPSQTLDSHGDHRIGMMNAIASLLIQDGPVHLGGAQAVSISYPEFFGDLEEVTTS